MSMSMPEGPELYLRISSKHSLIHIGSLDSFDITQGGKEAARCVLDYFESGGSGRLQNVSRKEGGENGLMLDSLKRAIDIYDKIIPSENFGGEYTALQWICRLLLAPEDKRRDFLSHPEVESWYGLLSENGFAKLREYIKYKYHFIEITQEEQRRSLRFLEDFILFSNPDRNRWEKTAENFPRLGLRPGETVADVGAGPGYFTFKFADIVGPDGKVYALETNPLHLNYLRKFIQRYDIRNVEARECHVKGIGLESGVKVNAVFMCSLYHVLYAALTEDERASYIGSIVNCLLPGGRLIIVDNGLVEEGSLPYHGPYIAKELIIAQLWHYGFTLLDSFQFTVQRYALVFEYTGEREPEPSEAGTERCLRDDIQTDGFPIRTRASLISYRIAEAAPTAGFTPRGKAAARLFLKALETKAEADLQTALDTYRDLIPRERIGDEYTAFEWFCLYLLADDTQRIMMLSDGSEEKGAGCELSVGLARSYFQLLAENDFAVLKKYLAAKYELSGVDYGSLDNITQLSEYIAFNNPNRNSWEKTEEMLACLGLRKGEVIADIGCGSGYFTYRFAKAVGASGLVYATEINRDALYYVERFQEELGNIKTAVSKLNDVCLPENSVDTVFMCSMYHAVYIASIEFVKDEFVSSLKRALKKDGRLVIVDNDIARPGVVPYYGSAIDRRLTIAQLRHYGFKLAGMRQFIPQRYVLVFRVCSEVKTLKP
ncbi:MAG: methyltransferase domain-containing protein [Clostridiales bacterium]|jgi:predicted methyltransferase|nr:methyltransferase domain-containing protein [Clostridiales bacterium]